MLLTDESGITEEEFTSLTEEERVKRDNALILQHYTREQKRLSEISESLRYAGTLQRALLPDENHIRQYVHDSFLFFSPKTDLSGDFTWMTRIGSKLIFTVADCTGHGVPGAMMSVMGLSLINQIVMEERCYEPSFILRRLDERISKAFSRYKPDERAETYDGMDIALCVFDLTTRELHFAGAMRSIWVTDESGIRELRGARYPIGGMRIEKARTYEGQSMKLTATASIYMFTDGYTDQFGGPNDKKINRSRLRKLICLVNELSMYEQGQQLAEFFHFWKMYREQTDDVTVLGLRL